MRLSKPKSWVTFLCLYVTLASVLSQEENRLKKHFSLFSVVQFNNEECTTDTTPTGGVTQGTCYTSTECSDKGGLSAGRCASGFGICCAFLDATAANAQIMENRTRLRNSEFPLTSASTANLNIAYTINKMQSDICQIRLDFATFVIAGPLNAEEKIPASALTNCVDTLTVATSSVTQVIDSSVGTLCGALTGEHMYVELSPTAADTATVTITTNVAAAATAFGGAANAITTNAAAADRLWDIKVSQIECFATYKAPQGCTRFLTADVGTITSYNFLILTNAGVNTGVELASQRVNTCIRRSKGMCCVEYNVCATFGGIALADTAQTGAIANRGVGINIAGRNQLINDGWSLDTNTDPFVSDLELNAGAIMVTLDGGAMPTATNGDFGMQINIGMVDNQCSGDYVEIPSSWSGGCGASHGSARNAINTRYCGARFGANFQASALTNVLVTHSTPVCDCSEPFAVRHNSDTVNDIGGTGAGGAGGVAAPNTANIDVAGTQARPRGFCLDYRQIPCWT